MSARTPPSCKHRHRISFSPGVQVRCLGLGVPDFPRGAQTGVVLGRDPIKSMGSNVCARDKNNAPCLSNLFLTQWH